MSAPQPSRLRTGTGLPDPPPDTDKEHDPMTYALLAHRDTAGGPAHAGVRPCPAGHQAGEVAR